MQKLMMIIGLMLFSMICYADDALPNLTLIKRQLVAYHDAGQYNQDLSETIRRAMYYLKFRVNQNRNLKDPKKLALVLDIDETSLSNYEDMKHLDFGGTLDEIIAAEASAHDPAIPYTRSLYDFAKKNGVAVFFITGRKEPMRASTIINLRRAGYQDWNGLYMRPINDEQKSVIPYKSQIRKQIVDQGYDIVENIGDQESDLKGGYADMSFKLADPYYFLS